MSVATQVSIPDRSMIQRMEALGRANHIRTFRKELKRELKAGRKSIVELLRNPPAEIETMKVFDLLMAVPKLGRTKVNKFLGTCRISPSKTVGGMTERQRNDLLVWVGRRY